MVTNVSHNQIRNSQLTPPCAGRETSKVSGAREKETPASSSDTISLRNGSSPAVTYPDAMKMNAEDEARYGMLRNLVANLLKEQGVNTKIAIGETDIDLAALTPGEAQELIGDDGYFGVEQTSGRIFQFAVGIAGGDPARIDAIKEGIEQGFAEAKEAFGDWLPDISYDTYDAVMKKLDDWAAQSPAMV